MSFKNALTDLILAQHNFIKTLEDIRDDVKPSEPKKYVPLKMPLIEPLIGIPMYTEQSLKCLTWEHAKGREAIDMLKEPAMESWPGLDKFLKDWEKGPQDGQD